MNQRRYVVCVVAACLVATLAVACAARSMTRQDATCRPRIDDDEGILRGDRRGDFLYFRVGYASDVEPLQKKAFQAGMAMWNRHSQLTGFVFEDATSTDADFRLQRGAPPLPPNTQRTEPIEKTDCAGFMTDGSFIWYSPPGMEWVRSDTDVANAARIYAHELGHGLNLKHKTGGRSVMHEGDLGTGCRDLATFILTDVQDSDARAAHRCGYGVRLKAQRQASAPRP